MKTNDISEKRAALGITTKEFADALGYGMDGEKKLRRWETGREDVPQDEYDRIMGFASVTPYKVDLENPEFRFIDLFAGIGGIRIPFQELGGKCVFTSEFDSFAVKTYSANFGNEGIYGDITKIKSGDIPDFDLLLAGFPCQPFSQAGLHKGFSDTRGTLFFEIERILRDRRPHAFLLENVKQLVGHDNGNTFNVIIEHLKALNYSVDYKVLAARDFGVPQRRERIYIVGFDRGYYGLDDDFHFKFPDPPKTETRLGDILETNVNEKYTLSDRLWAGHQSRRERNRMNGKGFGYSLFNEESRYVSTLSARYYKDGSEILIEQPDRNPRKLTPRECARLQGFPEEFIIPVSDCRAYKQFGNSVSVPVIRAISRQMKDTVDGFSNRTNDIDNG